MDDELAWTPMASRHNDRLWMAPVDGSTEPLALGGIDGAVGDVSMLPDGRSAIVLRSQGSDRFSRTNPDLVSVPLDGREIASVLPGSPAGEGLRPYEPRVSPDGKGVAFQDQNRQEVHIRSLDGSGGLQVSDAGGSRPVWGGDSSRLLYHILGGVVVMAELETAPTLAVRRRQRIESMPVVFNSGAVLHDVSRDGTYLVLAPADQGSNAMVAVDWAAGVRRQLRAGRE